MGSNLITVTVRLQGTCPTGHQVVHDQQYTLPAGARGYVTADANCGACGKPVALSGLIPITGSSR